MVSDRRAERNAFLLALYELTDGDTTAKADFREVGKRVDLSESKAKGVAQHLVERHLARWVAMGGVLGITVDGVDAAEKLQDEGATSSFAVTVLSVEEQAAVESFLTAYRLSSEKGDLDLTADVAAEVAADVATLEAQLRSPRPKRKIVRFIAVELHDILVGAAGSGAAVAIGKLVDVLR